MFIDEDGAVAIFKINNKTVFVYKNFRKDYIDIAIEYRGWVFYDVADIKFKEIRDYINGKLKKNCY